MRFYFFYFMLVIGILSVLFFSWIESPRLSLSGTLPNWIAIWADQNENENIRTAVPFIFLSVLIGIRLIILKKTELNWWFINFVLLVLLIFIAEIGQLFLPLRRFDWEDIGWAIVPSFIVLAVLFTINKLKFNE